MTRLTYLRLALFVPLVVPLMAIPLALVAPEPVVVIATSILGGSLVYAGIPYLLFAIGVLIWARGREAGSLRRVARILPVLFAPLAGVSLPLSKALLAGWSSHAWSFGDFLTGAFFGLALGYLYVFAVLAGEVRLFGRGRTDAASPAT